MFLLNNEQGMVEMMMEDEQFYWPLLYVPANRPGLEQFLFSRKSDGIKSVAICLEDAVRTDDRVEAMESLACWLHRLCEPGRPTCYIRPPDEASMTRLLDIPGIEFVEGFIIPKATPDKIAAWASASGGQFQLLPILETREALDAEGRHELAFACASVRHLVPRVRIGANDLFALLGGLRRPRGKTIYETPLGRVIDSMIEIFSNLDLPLSGSVFDRLDDLETLARECRDDVSRGLFAKTAVNPFQVAVILESYRPEPGEVEEAAKIMEKNSPAVFALNGSMLEPACHTAWALKLLHRAAALKFDVPRISEPSASPPVA